MKVNKGLAMLAALAGALKRLPESAKLLMSTGVKPLPPERGKRAANRLKVIRHLKSARREGKPGVAGDKLRKKFAEGYRGRGY